ncbi:hypothetical protein M0Q97_03255 [Candidatus Dojkabacteria bacterium]|jgi:hypothetical protein|nr:hypothetical protein [Candidatus Dojkabacteria bacterium]
MDVSFPHVANSEAAVSKFEPVVASNFNAYFVVMGALKEKIGDVGFLKDYVKSVSGLFVEYTGNTIEAGYKTVKFRYDSNEKQTFYDVEVAFHNFLDRDSKMFVYNKLAEMSRFKYNPLTGEKTNKVDYSDAMIIVEKFNRDGTVYWKRMGHHLFVMNDLPDQIADYTAHDMTELTVTFNVDYVTDVTNDPRLV